MLWVPTTKVASQWHLVVFLGNLSLSRLEPTHWPGTALQNLSATGSRIVTAPINTIFSAMNINLPALLGFTRYQGLDPSPCFFSSDGLFRNAAGWRRLRHLHRPQSHGRSGRETQQRTMAGWVRHPKQFSQPNIWLIQYMVNIIYICGGDLYV